MKVVFFAKMGLGINSVTLDFLFWYPRLIILIPKVFFFNSGTQGFHLGCNIQLEECNQTMHMYMLMQLMILFTLSNIDIKPYNALLKCFKTRKDKLSIGMSTIFLGNLWAELIFRFSQKAPKIKFILYLFQYTCDPKAVQSA